MGVPVLELAGRKQGNLGRRLCTDVAEQRFQTAQMANGYPPNKTRPAPCGY